MPESGEIPLQMRAYLENDQVVIKAEFIGLPPLIIGRVSTGIIESYKQTALIECNLAGNPGGGDSYVGVSINLNVAEDPSTTAGSEDGIDSARFAADVASFLSSCGIKEVIGPQEAFFEIGAAPYARRFLYRFYDTNRHAPRLGSWDHQSLITSEFLDDLRGRLTPSMPLVWRVVPEISRSPRDPDIWKVYCRFVQVPNEEDMNEARRQGNS